MKPMNQGLNGLLERLSAYSREAEEQFGSLGPGQLNWRPGPQQWSIGQCLDHLIVTNEAYYPQLEAVLRGEKRASFWERLPFLPGLFGRTLLRALDPENRKKSRTFPVFSPSQSDLPADVVNRFREHNRRLEDYFRRVGSLPGHERIIVTSPAASFVVYSLRDAFNIMVVHERRHLDQAKRVLAMEEFPSVE